MEKEELYEIVGEIVVSILKFCFVAYIGFMTILGSFYYFGGCPHKQNFEQQNTKTILTLLKGE